MNFFEQELRELFGDGGVIRAPWFSGNACLGIVDGDLRARVEFVDDRVSGYYETLKLTVLERTGGLVDAVKLNMADVLSAADGRQRSQGKPCITYSYLHKKIEWEGCRPTAADYQALRQSVDGYLDVFREQADRERPPVHKSSALRSKRGQER